MNKWVETRPWLFIIAKYDIKDRLHIVYCYVAQIRCDVIFVINNYPPINAYIKLTVLIRACHPLPNAGYGHYCT